MTTAVSKLTSALTLDRLARGQKAIVKAVYSGNRLLASKLLSMGVVAGSAIEVLGAAPLGDPIEVRTLGYRLSLRMSEAA